MTVTLGEAEARASDNAPSPPPISTTGSSGWRLAARTIRSRVLRSHRKFCPSRFEARTPCFRKSSLACFGELTSIIAPADLLNAPQNPAHFAHRHCDRSVYDIDTQRLETNDAARLMLRID